MAYNYLTQEGYDKIIKELEYLKSEGRAEVSKAIAEAREKGDLSENAEYDAAKDAQGLLELKINNMSMVLVNARILKPEDVDTSQVRVLATVKIKNTKSGKEFSYTLVSEAEANIATKRISVTSPIGSSLLGKEIGDIAEVVTPRATMNFEIMDISMNL